MFRHLKRPVGRSTEVFPAFDDKANRKQRFLEYTALSTKSCWEGPAELESLETKSWWNLVSLSLAVQIREHIWHGSNS